MKASREILLHRFGRLGFAWKVFVSSWQRRNATSKFRIVSRWKQVNPMSKHVEQMSKTLSTVGTLSKHAKSVRGRVGLGKKKLDSDG